MSAAISQEPLASLPHGPEFRFVDVLVELEPGRRGRATYELREGADFLKGHFPGRPMLPAVLMVEAIAQLAGVVAQSDPAIAPLADVRLTAIRGVKIFGSATPGDVVEVETEVLGRMGPLIQASGKVTLRGVTLAEGQVVLSGVEEEESLTRKHEGTKV